MMAGLSSHYLLGSGVAYKSYARGIQRGNLGTCDERTCLGTVKSVPTMQVVCHNRYILVKITKTKGQQRVSFSCRCPESYQRGLTLQVHACCCREVNSGTHLLKENKSW